MDAQQNTITNTILLPSKLKTDALPDEWSYLPPESVYDAQVQLGAQYENEYDEWDDYHNQKDEVLTIWFRESWLKAVEETGTKSNAYFSIHDTYWRTDVKDGKKINEAEIAKRYL